MSKPGTIYRITYQAFDPSSDIQEIVDISDNDNLIADSDTVTVIDLIPGADPVRGEINDTDEDPFTVVKSQTLTLTINTDNPINMNTFASGSDARWSVHNYIGNDTLFKGFLVMDDMSEAFMFDPKVLTLTATDSLGLLKDVPLTDFDGNNPVGEYPIAELLAMALSKTGLELGIKAAFNIKQSGYITDISTANSSNQHFFGQVYLNAKTFEDEIGTCISCYDVIKRILGEEARIFQWQGYWWILRVDEIENLTRGLYITEFDELGAFVGNLGEITFVKEIGKDSPYTMFFAREQTIVIPSRPLGSVELEHRYEYPKEILENIDFERGDVTDATNPLLIKYSLNDWVVLRGNPASPSIPTSIASIERVFNSDGYEKERYVRLTAASSASLATTNETYIISNQIPVVVGDKFTVSADWKIGSAMTGASTRYSMIKAILKGSDGNLYLLGNATLADEETAPKWYNTSNWTANTSAGGREIAFNELTETDWNNIEIVSAPVPVSGTIQILLHQFHQTGGTDNQDILWANLNFDYMPLVNGSYQKYSSQSQKVTQTDITKYRAKRESQIYITDSPKPLFKGALLQPLIYSTIYSGAVEFYNYDPTTTSTDSTFQISGFELAKFRVGQRLNIQGTASNNITCRVKRATYKAIGNLTTVTIDKVFTVESAASATIQEMTFELADEFYNAAVFPSGPPDNTYIHPYSEIQVFDVWNQFAIDRRVFQAVVQGMDLTVVVSSERDNAHLIHKWFFRDADDNTYSRCFQLLTFNQNHRTQEWTGLFREVDRFGTDKVYTNRTFKYKV